LVADGPASLGQAGDVVDVPHDVVGGVGRDGGAGLCGGEVGLEGREALDEEGDLGSFVVFVDVVVVEFVDKHGGVVELVEVLVEVGLVEAALLAGTVLVSADLEPDGKNNTLKKRFSFVRIFFEDF